MSHQLLIQPQAIFVGRRLRTNPWRPAQQPHPRRRLKHVRRKWAAVHIKLHPQISRIRYPRYLVAFIQHHGLRYQSNKYRAFSHCFVRIAAPFAAFDASFLWYLKTISHPAPDFAFRRAFPPRITPADVAASNQLHTCTTVHLTASLPNRRLVMCVGPCKS